MVGKIQDIVSASIVAGAAERVSDTSARMVAPENEEPKVKRLDDVQNAPKYNQAEEEEDPLEEREEREPMDEETVSYMMQELNELMSKINCNLQHDAGIKRAHEQD